MHNSVSKAKFEFSLKMRAEIREKLDINDFLIIGFVGGFNYPKNTAYFLDIAKKLLLKRKDFRILMLGDGKMKQKFIKKLRRAKLEKYFLLLGNKPNANEYYNAFDCFLLPSRFEGLPYVGIEAQVNGLKCFFSNKITRQVKITESAEFFDLKDVDGLSKKLAQMNIRGDSSIKPLDNFNLFVC